MPASVDRLQFAPPAPPGMLRAIGLALAAHVLLMLALTWGVNWKREPMLLSVEAELWSSVPQQAAPKLVEPVPVPPAPIPLPVPPPVIPAVKPAPVPAPAPPEADIAIEREKEKQRADALKAQAQRRQLALERKREAEKEADAQRKVDARRKAELARAKAAEDQQKQEAASKRRIAEDEKRMEAQRQTNLDRMKGMAGATGTALRASGPSASYAGRVVARVKPNIVFTEEFTGNPRAEIEVRTAPDGTIVAQRILKSSGVRIWDEAVLKAVIKTEVLPRDLDGRVPPLLIIDFRPRD